MSTATRSVHEPIDMERSVNEALPVVSLNVPSGVHLKATPEDFDRLAACNGDVRLELTAAGDLIVTAPEGSSTGSLNFRIGGQLFVWTRSHGGIGFGSSSGFTLPNGAIRSPDAAWIMSERWNSLPDNDKQGFARIVPDFVIELRSPSDRIEDVRAKMNEYVAAGVRLGWLIDPETKCVTVYRPDLEPERLDDPKKVSGEGVLPGFELDMTSVYA